VFAFTVLGVLLLLVALLAIVLLRHWIVSFITDTCPFPNQNLAGSNLNEPFAGDLEMVPFFSDPARNYHPIHQPSIEGIPTASAEPAAIENVNPFETPVRQAPVDSSDEEDVHYVSPRIRSNNINEPSWRRIKEEAIKTEEDDEEGAPVGNRRSGRVRMLPRKLEDDYVVYGTKKK